MQAPLAKLQIEYFDDGDVKRHHDGHSPQAEVEIGIADYGRIHRPFVVFGGKADEPLDDVNACAVPGDEYEFVQRPRQRTEKSLAPRTPPQRDRTGSTAYKLLLDQLVSPVHIRASTDSNHPNDRR